MQPGEYKDITGKRFGFLVAVKVMGRDRRRRYLWMCLCDCGKNTTAYAYLLQSGRKRSCGCQMGNKTHGHARVLVNGRYTVTPTYSTWLSMAQRCGNARKECFQRYGARGIKICDRWLNSFEAFLADMGERPVGRTIDRINNSGNYEPGNCRWATPKEQAKNKRPKSKHRNRREHEELRGTA